MFKKLTLAAAAGAGYVLGAKAGKERYRQIEAKFREIAGMPAVQSATTTVVEAASTAADTAKAAASDTVAAASDKVAAAADKAKGKGDTDVVVDLGADTGTGVKTSAPMAGAAASGSAPDVTRP